MGAARVGRELSEAAARLHSIFAQAAEVTQLPAEHVGRCQAILAAGMQAAASQALMHETEDHMEGVHAILEKRAPKFEGK